MAGFHGCDPGLGHRRYDTTDVAAAMRDDPAALYEYDMTRSPTATLPASWMTHDATMRHYRGLVWYQRDFTADPKPGERQFLQIGRALCRESVCQYVYISVVAVPLKKEHANTLIHN